MNRAFLYLRFSDSKQIGGTSIATQEASCQAYCQNNGYEITGCLKSEAISANETNVSRVLDLISFCKANKGKFETLVVYKIDRFARSADQHFYLKSQLAKIGVNLRSATEAIDDTPVGKLMETMLAGVAEFDNNVRKERGKLAMARRITEGLWPWPPPLGYMPNRIEGIKLSPIIEDTTCSGYIKEIFERYSVGANTLESLSKEYGAKNIHNYKGRLIKFSKQSIDHTLRNPLYIGYTLFKGKLTQAKHVPLISYSLFKQCEDVRMKRTNHTTKTRYYYNPDFPLRSFVYCGECGKLLTACMAKKKFPYYYCVNPSCSKKSKMIKKGTLENEFAEYLKQIKPEASFVERFEKGFIQRYQERELEIKGDYLRGQKEIEQLVKDETWVVEKGKSGVLPDRVVKEQLAEIGNKLTLLKLKQSEKHTEELSVSTMVLTAKEFINNLEFTWADASPEAKVKLQKMIFPQGVKYNYPGFKNSKMSPIFEAINTFATASSMNVTPHSTASNFSFTEIKAELAVWYAYIKENSLTNSYTNA